MKIIFTKSRKEIGYTITELKFTKTLMAINIVDTGWKTVEPHQYDTFYIVKD